jgi:2-keto-4-pentenoate hydratase
MPEPAVDGARLPGKPGEREVQAAQLLVAVRRGAPRLAALPAALAPQTLSEAYAVQHEVLRRLSAKVGGWKVSLFDARNGICAPIAANTLLASPALLTTTGMPTCNTSRLGIESEVAFQMRCDLPPRAGAAYGLDEVLAAVASAHPVVEIVVSRFVDADAVSQLERVADAFMNEALIIGPPCADWRALALAELPLQVAVDGVMAHSARGGHPLGDPLLPLVWLANHLAGLGAGLRRGDYVTTGSCDGIRYIQAGQRVRTQFTGLGTVEISFQ